MSATKPRPRGRPRVFDRRSALRQAMEVFWAAGYEGATLTTLQEAMGGINAPSFYAAFGSKEALFREAVELYSLTLGSPLRKALDEEPSARTAIHALLCAAVSAFCKPGKPRGCMLVSTAMGGSPAEAEARAYVRRLRARRKIAIVRRITRGIAEDELPPKANARALASFVVTVVDGLAIQARDGASRKSLDFAVRCAMRAWDAAIKDAQ